MTPLLALALGGYSIGQLAIFIIVVAGIAAIVFIALRQMGVSIPPLVIQIVWVLVVVVVCVLAVQFLMSL